MSEPTTNIDLVECTGDHYTMGIIQGEARRAQIGRLHQAAFELTRLDAGSVVGSMVHRATPSIASIVGRVGKHFMGSDLDRHYPSASERLRGISDGAGVGVHDLYLGPAVEYALNKSSYELPGACTAVAITGSKSRDGEPMIAKNFDYPDAARESYLARLSRPDQGAASIDVTAAPMAGSHEGMNQHGLAVAYNYGYFQGQVEARVTITNLVQEMLELCATVSEAIDYLQRRPRSGGAILMIADADGDLASVEVAPSCIGVRRAKQFGDRLCHANHALTDTVKPYDIPEEAVCGRFSPKDVRGLPVHRSSWRRQERGDQLLDRTDVLTEQDLAAVVADHSDCPDGDDFSICRHGPYYLTTCSLLLFPRRRSIKLMFGAPCASQYATFSL